MITMKEIPMIISSQDVAWTLLQVTCIILLYFVAQKLTSIYKKWLPGQREPSPKRTVSQ